jgi:hypothetical protein
MQRWPPIIWPVMAFAGLLLVMGLRAGKDWAPASAVVLEVAVVALAAHLALARRRRRPIPRWLPGLLGCLALFYLASGLAAAMAWTRYLPIVLLAALIPTAAVLLMLATVRVKPASANEDRHADPYPGIGSDDRTPVSDTPEHADVQEGIRPR